MAILLSLDSLSTSLQAFGGPIIAQQFVNHGGLVHKVSVVGSKVRMSERQSALPQIVTGIPTAMLQLVLVPPDVSSMPIPGALHEACLST